MDAALDNRDDERAHDRAQADMDRRTWKDIAARWLFGQDVSTVLLVIILASLWYMGYYAMNTAIPAHLQSIQAGYERMEKSHAESLLRVETSHNASIKYIADAFREAARERRGQSP